MDLHPPAGDMSSNLLPPSSPDPSTATAQREGDSLISDLGLNSNVFLGNLHSSGKGQQILCVVSLPPLQPYNLPPAMSGLQGPLPLADYPPPHSVSLSVALKFLRPPPVVGPDPTGCGSTVHLMNSFLAHSEPALQFFPTPSSCLGNKGGSTCPTSYNG